MSHAQSRWVLNILSPASPNPGTMYLCEFNSSSIPATKNSYFWEISVELLPHPLLLPIRSIHECLSRPNALSAITAARIETPGRQHGIQNQSDVDGVAIG